MNALDHQEQQPPAAKVGTSANSEQVRVELAAERTLLSWVRTGLAMMGFGFVVARFGLFLRELAVAHEVDSANSPSLSLWFGTALILLGVIVNVVSAYRHTRLISRLRSGEPALPSSTFSIGLTVVLAVLGVATAAYLIAISGNGDYLRKPIIDPMELPSSPTGELNARP